MTLTCLLLAFLVSSPAPAQETDSSAENSVAASRSYPCVPIWNPPSSPFDPIWVPDWNIWLPAFSPDALYPSEALGLFDRESTSRPPGWTPWVPQPPCRRPWPPIFLPLPWEPQYPPSTNQAIYLGSGTSLVDGAGSVCTPVELLAATGQTGFSLPFPATSFPTFGGYTHVTSPTPGGTYLNTLYSWHKIHLVLVRVRGSQGTSIESYSPTQLETNEYIVYDADGTALRFRVVNQQLIPAFGVYAQLRNLGDFFVLIGGPPGAINQKGAWLYFFSEAELGYAWGSAWKAHVQMIRDPLGNYWRLGYASQTSVVWQAPNNVFLLVDVVNGTLYFSANQNPPQWQLLGKMPGPLGSGDPRGTSEVMYWGNPADRSQNVAYRWSVSQPVGAEGVTLEAGYVQGSAFMPQVQYRWWFTGEPQGYTNGRGEQQLYTTMYGSLPANYYGRLYKRQWGDAFPTHLEYRNATPFGVETTIYPDQRSWDYTRIRHRESNGDKKFDVVEVERPRFDNTGISLERVKLSATNGQPIERSFFDLWNPNYSPPPLWTERYEYTFAEDPLALTGYVDRQGNRYRYEYERRETGMTWDSQNPEKETVLRKATDPTGVEITLNYGEGYTLPPQQIQWRNPPTVPSSVQLGSHPDRKWRFGYSFDERLQRAMPNGLLRGFSEPPPEGGLPPAWWRFEYTTLSNSHPFQLSRIIDPTERFSQIKAWDSLGRPTRMEVYPHWNGSTYSWDENRPVWQEVQYDPIGRVQEVWWGYQHGSQVWVNGSVSYQWEGHLLKGFTDARGRRVEFLYDQRPPYRTGLLNDISIVGDGQRSLYASLGYDPWGRLVSVKGGNGVGLEYAYTYRDALWRIYHDGDRLPNGERAYEEFAYSDCCGQVSRWTRQDGQQLQFTYTLNGWLYQIYYKGLNDLYAQLLYQYDYDAAGRLTSAQSAVSTVKHTYDTTDSDRTGWLERTDTTLNGRTNTFAYDYYLNGDLKTFNWLNQSIQNFGYDRAGRLEWQSYRQGNLSFTVTYGYDGAGRLTAQEIQIGNNRLTTALEYADHQSVGSVWWQATAWNGADITFFGYEYYPDGTLRSAREGRGAGARQLAWDYYPDGSLMYEQDTLQGGRRDFAYDAGGNMLTGVPAAPNAIAQYAYNQLRQIGNWAFGYNLNGERISEQNSPTGSREYGYDGFGNLVWVKQNGQLVYEAQYDALGRRVAYRTPAAGGWIYLLYDGDALVAEMDPWGNVLAEYVWGQLGPVARVERSGLYGYRVLLYVCDALGHVRMLVDASTGQVVDRYAYDAWGNLIAREGSTHQPFTWNGAYGYEWIPEVGLYHVGARAYDPRTARWLQRDPIDAASGDPNLYWYAGNDPINFVDPTGTDWNYHDLLDAAGFIPVIGDLADAANAIGYALEGDYVNAAISAASALGGDVLKAGRLAKKVVQEVVEEGAEQVAKREAKNALQEQGKKAGRSGRQKRLHELKKDDPKQPKHVRGWIKQEENQIKRGKRKNRRNPPGYELAHRRGKEARKGYDYRYSDLQCTDLHRLQHKVERKKKRR